MKEGGEEKRKVREIRGRGVQREGYKKHKSRIKWEDGWECKVTKRKMSIMGREGSKQS